ncbi:MAG: hypothetical protein OXF68_02105 [Gammaproteobacteria bacterium]|nr:hypothetical protein [Gammaproteobacteria bacterium]
MRQRIEGSNPSLSAIKPIKSMGYRILSLFAPSFGRVGREVERILNQLEHDQLIVDYELDIPNRDEAEEGVALARTVVESTRTALAARAD